MIDWLAFVAPLAHSQEKGGPFYAGDVFATIPDTTDPSGERLEWHVYKRKKVEGSHSSTITVKSTTDEMGRPSIYVSGNPAKWFQGHNIFGADDLPGLVREMLHRICASVGIEPSADDVALWDAGIIKLLRVDVTYSYSLQTLARVRNALRSLSATANLEYRGRGNFKGDSLIYGEKSRRWSLTLYAKGAEIQVHKLPIELRETSLPDYAQGLLRAEVRLHGLELKREHLEYVCYWGDNAASELHRRKMEGLHVADNVMLDAHTIEGISPRLQLAYTSWKEGHDLRAILPRNTFYRYRTELLKHGIDIAVKQERSTPEASNVVPIRTVLHAHPVGVPEWAVGTPLYFEPRAKVA